MCIFFHIDKGNPSLDLSIEASLNNEVTVPTTTTTTQPTTTTTTVSTTTTTTTTTTTRPLPNLPRGQLTGADAQCRTRYGNDSYFARVIIFIIFEDPLQL